MILETNVKHDLLCRDSVVKKSRDLRIKAANIELILDLYVLDLLKTTF